MFKKIHELCRQLVGWSHNIDQHGIDGISGHAVEFCRSRVLYHHYSVFFFYGTESYTAVGAHA